MIFRDSNKLWTRSKEIMISLKIADVIPRRCIFWSEQRISAATNAFSDQADKASKDVQRKLAQQNDLRKGAEDTMEKYNKDAESTILVPFDMFLFVDNSTASKEGNEEKSRRTLSICNA